MLDSSVVVALKDFGRLVDTNCKMIIARSQERNKPNGDPIHAIIKVKVKKRYT